MISPLALMASSFLLGIKATQLKPVPAAKPITRALIYKIEKDNPTLNHQALLAGIRAYVHLRKKGQDQKQRLTIVDFNQPSITKRLWIINMKDGHTDYVTYVAHGKNSGSNVAKYFSNKPNSHESSIGVYLTGHTYYGIDGYSLRLHGLDRGFNNNVYKRHIVIHPAWYVSSAFAKKHHRLGRTYGCFGINKKLAPKIIATIKNNTILVAYYPNKDWLKKSIYEKPLKLY